MAPNKPIRHRPAKKTAISQPSGTTVACWEDDPGDPRSQPPLMPIEVSVPSQSAQPLPFKISGATPATQNYPAGTANFRFFAAAAALRRTADFWGGIVKTGTRWQ